MTVKKLPNGNLIVPVRVTGPGGIVGDATREIGPDDPQYAKWLDWHDREARAEQATADAGQPGGSN